MDIKLPKPMVLPPAPEMPKHERNTILFHLRKMNPLIKQMTFQMERWYSTLRSLYAHTQMVVEIAQKYKVLKPYARKMERVFAGGYQKVEKMLERFHHQVQPLYGSSLIMLKILERTHSGFFGMQRGKFFEKLSDELKQVMMDKNE